MSQVNFMEKLLDGVEVEWKTVKDIFNTKNGYTPSKAKPEYWTNGNVPWFRMEDLRKNGNVLNQAIQYTHTSGIKGKLFPANSIIMATTATIGEHALITVDYMCNQQFTNFTIKDEFSKLLDIKFVYYYFFLIDEKAKQSVNTSSFPSVQMNELKKWEFPIPPLKVQSEIVRILDNFTELTAELTAELSARKKQYHYYRDQLLSFKEGEVEWKSLGEVATIGTGNHDTKDAIDNGNYIFYARGKKPLMLNSYDFDETAIITAGDGVGVGKVFHWAVGKYALHQRAYRIVPNRDINARYVYHYILANFYVYIEKTSVHSSVQSLRKPMFLKFPIPIPTLEKQKEIVAILDKFDTLTNSISEGLPKEIALRQKQYEYYRNLLLSFPKKEVEA